MADWTDGAAYAPIERPDGFATPEAAPLTVAERQLASTPGPIPPPHGFTPSAPQAPLEQIRTTPPPNRNPAEPFHTASAALTAAPGTHPEGERDPLQPFTTYATSAGSQELPPPTGAPLAPPSGPPIAFGDQPPPAAHYPAPVPATSGAEIKTLRTLLILAIVALGIGIVLPSAAPWLVLVAGLLGLRTKPLSGSFGAWASGTGVTLLVLAALAGEATNGLNGLAAIVFVFWAGYGLRKNPTSRR